MHLKVVDVGVEKGTLCGEGKHRSGKREVYEARYSDYAGEWTPSKVRILYMSLAHGIAIESGCST